MSIKKQEHMTHYEQLQLFRRLVTNLHIFKNIEEGVINDQKDFINMVNDIYFGIVE